MKTRIKFQIIIVFAILQFVINNAYSQKFSKDLPPFTSIMVSNRINLVIQQGNNYNIKGIVENVKMEELVIKVEKGRLKVYLDKAKLSEKNKIDKSSGYKRKIGYYANNVKVNVVVTCNMVEKLEIRGEQEVTCEKLLDTDKFRLIVYGEPYLKFDYLSTEKLIARIHGESNVDIANGNIKFQSYLLFGENKINIKNVNNEKTKITSFGENNFSLSKNNIIKVTSMGEGIFMYGPGSKIERKVILGKNKFIDSNFAGN